MFVLNLGDHHLSVFIPHLYRSMTSSIRNSPTTRHSPTDSLLRLSNKPEPSQTSTRTEYSQTRTCGGLATVCIAFPHLWVQLIISSNAVAGRTLLHTIIQSLERIAFNGNPLKLLVVETTYQPFISLFHQMDMFKNHPRFEGIRKSFTVS